MNGVINHLLNSKKINYVYDTHKEPKTVVFYL